MKQMSKLSFAKMKLKYEKAEPFNFAGLENQSYEKAKVVVFPVPYYSTTYWHPDTKFGPQALIEASRHMELYDLELEKNLSKVGIYTLDPLAPSKNSPLEVVNQIEKVVSQLLKDKKLLFMSGGEHSITLGAVKAVSKKFKKLSVLYFDAHTDMRNEFEGTKYHHGTVARRISELPVSLTQVGIRAVCEEEASFLKKHPQVSHIFLAPDVPIQEIINTLDQNVYISVDLDSFDPSIMPSTGTPEPGGLSWEQVIGLIKEVSKQKNIVGFDIVELSPIPGISFPEFLAAKLAYKIIGYSLLQ